MKTKEEIEKLITDLLDDSLAPGEVLDQGLSYDSSKTVAAYAKKRIDELTVDDTPLLKEMLLSQKNKDRRSELYHLIGILAKRNNIAELIHFLIECVAKEKTRSFIASQLSGISLSLLYSGITLTEQADIILEYAKHKHWSIRHSAIEILAYYKSNNKEIECFLISVLNNSKDEYDIYYTNITLQKIGTKQSIEPLRNIIQEHNRADIVNTGLYALNIIDGKNQVDFFIEMMTQKKGVFIKSSLTKLISEHADNSAIDLIIKRVKTILSRKRSTNIHYGKNQYPEIVHAIRYLNKYEEEDAKIGKLKNWILTKKLDFLDETELTWIKEHFK